MIEIDGVQRLLERPITEAGDYLSDEYFRLIDLATTPRNRSDVAVIGLVGAIRRLNHNIGATTVYLRMDGMADVYDDVITQINEINADLPDCEKLAYIADMPEHPAYTARYLREHEPRPQF